MSPLWLLTHKIAGAQPLIKAKFGRRCNGIGEKYDELAPSHYE
jgi:hypothetical protein